MSLRAARLRKIGRTLPPILGFCSRVEEAEKLGLLGRVLMGLQDQVILTDNMAHLQAPRNVLIVFLGKKFSAARPKSKPSSRRGRSMSLAYPLLRLPCRSSLAAPRASPSPSPPISVSISSSAPADGGEGELTGRERRQQRRERRELRARDWKEEVQERLIHEPARRRKKPPKRTWQENLNLNFLAEHGPQWWLVRVSMAPGTDYVELLTKAISRRYPEFSFKIYNPSIQVKKRLKSGSISTKSKPMHPGLVFLYCTLNKEIHDFIRDTEGCYGFIGATVGSIKRQIKKPKPIPVEEVESIIREEKEEQERIDREFEKMENGGNVESFNKPIEDSELMLINKIKKQFKKSTSRGGTSHSAFTPGATVHVLSGPFAGFTGSLLEVNRKNKKVRLMNFILVN
ncbi:hypothetical protein GUJ93_ZPchr0003g17653 [Zizania palustris]|uniref:NusG-like N-terminal domain-containing protein n=1 Tax=Zizania palustris TaxID=103762 RepID=A0A8J5SJP6_ZIZPA|nr:hypothetical protein GUJ93_ZPchr0003g17653 [Zizania palustris]